MRSGLQIPYSASINRVDGLSASELSNQGLSCLDQRMHLCRLLVGLPMLPQRCDAVGPAAKHQTIAGFSGIT